MPKLCRSVQFCALAALSGLAAPAGAQDALPNSPPELRDFQLRPATPPPAEPEPRIAPVTRPPVVAVPAPPPSESVTPTPAEPTNVTETRPRAAPPPRPAPERVVPAPAAPPPATEAPVADGLPETVEAESLPPLDVQIAPPQAPVAEAAEAQPPSLPGWAIWAAVALTVVGAGIFFAASRLRRREPKQDPEILDREHVALDRLLKADPAVPPAASVPEPVAAPEPPPTRPWIEIEFRPGIANATADHTVIEYELLLRNTGGGAARNVRGAARIFSASTSQNAELATFFAEAVEPAGAPRTILPGDSVVFQQALMLPKEEIKPVEVQGRSLLIPLIAFNVRYDWADGEEGQTAMSFVVGREAQPPAEKMAPLRLDLGPRVYRQLAKRQHALKLVA